MKTYSQLWYAKNKDKQLRHLKQMRQKSKAFMNSLKSIPCMDCGGVFPPCCMDFDHVRGTKVIEISKLAASGHNEKRIKEEAEKCDVVCSNCHRIRTQKRISDKDRGL